MNGCAPLRGHVRPRPFRVLDRSVLLLILPHMPVHHTFRFIYNLLKEDDSPFSRAHAKHETSWRA